jgi:hypothetical protein
VSSVNAVKPSPNEQNSNVPLQPLKVSGFARPMAGEALALKQKLAENDALKLKLFMAARPARCEPNAA